MKILSVVGAKPNYVKLAAFHDVFTSFLITLWWILTSITIAR